MRKTDRTTNDTDLQVVDRPVDVDNEEAVRILEEKAVTPEQRAAIERIREALGLQRDG